MPSPRRGRRGSGRDAGWRRPPRRSRASGNPAPGWPPAVLGGRVRPHATPEVRQVAAADGTGAGGQQHVFGRQRGGVRGRDLDLLETEGTAERLCPHGGAPSCRATSPSLQHRGSVVADPPCAVWLTSGSSASGARADATAHGPREVEGAGRGRGRAAGSGGRSSAPRIAPRGSGGPDPPGRRAARPDQTEG